MDQKTFLAALSKYKKVRSADYQGKLSRSIPLEERKADDEKTGSGEGSAASRRRPDPDAKNVLQNSPFFKLLVQKLAESGDVPNALEGGE